MENEDLKTQPVESSFFKKKNLIISGAIIALLVFIFGYWIPRGECISKINATDSKYRYYTRYFHEYSEAMNYCLHEKSFLF